MRTREPLRDPEPEAAGGDGQQALPLDDKGAPVVPPAADPKVTALEQQLAQQGQSLAQLQQLLRSRPAATPAAPTPSPDEINAEFFKNPVPIVSAIAEQRMQQAVAQLQAAQHEPNVKAAREEIRRGDPELFDKFLPQIQARVGQYHPQAHTDSRIWESAYKAVLGENLDEVYRMRQQRKSNGGPGLPSNRPSPAAKPEGLSDEEKHVARKIFHMTPEEYTAGKQLFEKQKHHDPDPAIDALESPYAQHITFDSAHPRKPRKKAGVAA